MPVAATAERPVRWAPVSRAYATRTPALVSGVLARATARLPRRYATRRRWRACNAKVTPTAVERRRTAIRIRMSASLVPRTRIARTRRRPFVASYHRPAAGCRPHWPAKLDARATASAPTRPGRFVIRTATAWNALTTRRARARRRFAMRMRHTPSRAWLTRLVSFVCPLPSEAMQAHKGAMEAHACSSVGALAPPMRANRAGPTNFLRHVPQNVARTRSAGCGASLK